MTKQQTVELLKQQLPGFYSVEQETTAPRILQCRTSNQND